MDSSQISGQVAKLYYASDDFCAGLLETVDGKSIRFSVKFPLELEENCTLRGRFKHHTKYGWQFEATGVEKYMPVDREGLVRFLAESDSFKGIGRKRAEDIVNICDSGHHDSLGDDFEELLIKEPERLLKIKGITPKIVETLKKEWMETRDVNTAITVLAGYDLTMNQISKVIKKYGSAAVHVVKENPYSLTDTIDGFGFRRADEIALKAGMQRDSKIRIQAGLIHIVKEQLNDGHTWIHERELLAETETVLQLPQLDADDIIHAHLDSLIHFKKLKCYSYHGTGVIALPHYFEMEKKLLHWLKSDHKPIDKVLKQVEQSTLNQGQRDAFIGALGNSQYLISGPAGAGKAQPLDAKILTQAGWKKMRYIYPGSRVFGSNGQPCRVTGVYPQGIKDVYRVTMTDGSTTECCNEHLWFTSSQKERDGKQSGSVKPLHEIKEMIKDKNGKRNHWIPIVSPVVFPKKLLPVDPYAMGLLLGDGCFRIRNGCGLSNPEPEIIKSIIALLPEGNRLVYQHRIDYRIIGNGSHGGSPLLNILKSYGLADKYSSEKFIPNDYKFSCVSQRIALLQGILDTDGSTHGHTLEFTSTSKQLAEDVRFIIQSLGGTCSFNKRQTYHTYKGIKKPGKPSYRLHICLPEFISPFRLLRKANNYIPNTKYLPRRAIEKVEYIGKKEVQCIAVDSPDQLYVTDNFIVTHNTFVLNQLVDEFQNQELSITLCAPTGKAARRMEEVCEMPALTIHKLLGYDGRGFNYHGGNKLVTDVLILDEVSMVDIWLFYHLMDAIDIENTKIIFAGDHNQLPPVGAGNVLRDILQQNLIPYTVLTEVVRQAGTLKKNSLQILDGVVHGLKKTDSKSSDWIINTRYDSHTDLINGLITLYRDILPLEYDDLIRDVQVLSPMKKTDIGVIHLNRILQNFLQERVYGRDIAPGPKGSFQKLYPGDKVIQTKNDYKLGVMNGHMGVVRVADYYQKKFIIEFENNGALEIEQKNLKNISLAYCLTVHKVQGSEFPCVITIMHSSHYIMLHQNLFYTSVSRAKKQSFILGDLRGIKTAAKNKQVDKRRTFLSLMGENR